MNMTTPIPPIEVVPAGTEPYIESDIETVPYDQTMQPDIYDQMFAEQEVLFPKPDKPKQLFPDPEPLPVGSNYAINVAEQWAALLQMPLSEADRLYYELLQSGSNIEDYIVSRVSQINKKSYIQEIVQNPDLSLEDRVEAITFEMNRIKAVDLSPLDPLIWKYYLEDNEGDLTVGELPLQRIEELRGRVTPTNLLQLSKVKARSQLEKYWRIIEEAAAMHGWTSTGDMVGELLQQEFIPFYPILSRAGLINHLANAADIELDFTDGLLMGEGRQAIREALANANDTGELEQMLQDMTFALKEAQKHPIIGPLITDINAVEFLMFTLTDEALMGNPKDRVDRIAGNFEFFIEAIYGVSVVFALMSRGSKVAKAMTTAKASGEPISIRTAFRQTEASRSVQVTGAVGNNAEHKKVLKLLQDDKRAAKYGMNPSVAAAALLPKPFKLGDDVTAVLDDAAELEQIERLEMRASRLTNAVGERSRRQYLNVDEQANAILKETRMLDEADTPPHFGASSTIDVTDWGFRINQILGQFGGLHPRGWIDFDDLLLELKLIDPEFRKFQIMYKADDGTFQPIILTKKQIDEIAASAKQIKDPKTGEFVGFKDEWVGRRLGELIKMGLPTTDIGKITGKTEYFLQRTVERYWHPTDKHAFNTKSLGSGFRRNFLWFLPPASKFDGEFYNPFLTSWLDEQAVSAKLKEISTPYRKLSASSQRNVQGVLEWAEDWAKKYGRAPRYDEVYDEFPNFKKKEFLGLAAYQTVNETMFSVLNHTLRGHMAGQSFQTIRPIQSAELPQYHGKVLDRSSGSLKPASDGLIHIIDPITLKMRKYTPEEVDGLYAKGDTVIDIDLPISTVDQKVMGTRILVDQNEYRLGKLADEVLEYHPGYHPRFYKDPWYVIKREMVTKNGVKEEVQTALRTARSKLEGQVYVNRINTRIHREHSNADVQLELVAAKNIDQTDSKMFQQQVLNREGRLFWDQRQFTRLPNVNRNSADIEDATVALDRAINLVAREITGRDPMAAAKVGWVNLYGKTVERAFRDIGLLAKGERLDLTRLSILDTKLKSARIATTDTNLLHKLEDAHHYVKYFRLMEGSVGNLVPNIRKGLLRTFEGLNKFWKTGKPVVWRGLENWAMQADPFRMIRSISHTLFIKMRPFRQLPMQSAQVMFLSGIDPTYITTGRVFKDIFALALGKRKVIDALDDGYSVKTLAGMMGLTQKQYKKLVIEIDKSGLWQAIDVHDFAAEVVSMTKRGIRLPSAGNPLSYTRYGVQKYGRAVTDTLGQGFVKGEMNNITGTYMVALRRFMKNNDIKDLTKIESSGWNAIRVDTSNLALGMVKPNNMAYQQGMFSIMLQFMSFQHKAFIALMGKNPAISQSQAVRLWISGLMLYGTEFVGMGYLVSRVLEENGLGWANETKLDVVGIGDRYTIADYLRDGLLFNMINSVGHKIGPDSKHDIDLSALVPSFDADRWSRDMVTSIFQDPFGYMMGPSGAIAGKFLDSFSTARDMTIALDDLSPHESMAIWLTQLTKGTVPLINDAHRGYIAYKTRRMFTSTGKALMFDGDVKQAIARLAGFGTVAERLYYEEFRNSLFSESKTFDQAVKSTGDFISTHLREHYDNQNSVDYAIASQKFAIEKYKEMHSLNPIQEVLKFAFGMYKEELGPQRFPEFLQKTMAYVPKGWDHDLMHLLVREIGKQPVSPQVLDATRRLLEVGTGDHPVEDAALLLQMFEDIADADRLNSKQQLQNFENLNRNE